VVVGRRRVGPVEGLLSRGDVEGVDELLEGGHADVGVKVEAVEAERRVSEEKERILKRGGGREGNLL
jgi:hypothetical protein